MGYEMKRYKRIHPMEHASDVEQGKIKKETERYLSYEKKAKSRMDLALRQIQSLEDADELMEAFDDDWEHAEKDRKNAKVHKKRLHRLMENDEFEGP